MVIVISINDNILLVKYYLNYHYIETAKNAIFHAILFLGA